MSTELKDIQSRVAVKQINESLSTAIPIFCVLAFDWNALRRESIGRYPIRGRRVHSLRHWYSCIFSECIPPLQTQP